MEEQTKSSRCARRAKESTAANSRLPPSLPRPSPTISQPPASAWPASCLSLQCDILVLTRPSPSSPLSPCLHSPPFDSSPSLIPSSLNPKKCHRVRERERASPRRASSFFRPSVRQPPFPRSIHLSLVVRTNRRRKEGRKEGRRALAQRLIIMSAVWPTRGRRRRRLARQQTRSRREGEGEECLSDSERIDSSPPPLPPELPSSRAHIRHFPSFPMNLAAGWHFRQ